MKNDLKAMTAEEIGVFLGGIGTPGYLSRYVFDWVQKKGTSDIMDITPLPKSIRQALAESFLLSNLRIVERLLDEDGTVKYLFELEDSRRIETVVLSDEGRKTVCLSTQSGCSRRCAFCATAHLGFTGNLSAGQIVDQVIKAAGGEGKISNVVYMGMGEPMDNYDAVIRSARLLNDPAGQNIGARHITISTCGVAAGIKRLAKEELGVRLAISLHATDDKTRAQIMPGVRNETLAGLIAAIREYQAATKQRVTFEYLMIKGLNDSPAHARQAAKLARQVKSNVNLIEYNPHPHSNFSPSDRKTIKTFREILEGLGIETVIRFRRGRSIQAACGQLGAAMPGAKQVPANQ